MPPGAKLKRASGPARKPAGAVIGDIRRATRRQVSAAETIRTVLEGWRGDAGVAEPCRRAGIAGSMYGGRSRAFREAGSRRPAGDAARADAADEVSDLRQQTGALRAVAADLRPENRLLKGGLIAAGGEEARGGRPREAGDHPAGRAVSAPGAGHPGEARDHERSDMIQGGTTPKIVAPTRWLPRAPTGNPAKASTGSRISTSG